MASCSLLLNVNGFVDDPEILAQARLRAFLDIDPGFGQMWRELGLHDAFRDHHAFVTVGENGSAHPDCSIPTGGIEWITTPQPVVLSQWPVTEATGERFTSVGSWRGPFGPVEYGGHRDRGAVALRRSVHAAKEALNPRSLPSYAPSMVTRSAVAGVAVAALLLAVLAVPREGGFAAAPERLTLREFDVPAGSHPHDVAPARRRRRLVHGAARGRARPARPATGEVREIPLGAGLGAARRDRRAGRRRRGSPTAA